MRACSSAAVHWAAVVGRFGAAQCAEHQPVQPRANRQRQQNIHQCIDIFYIVEQAVPPIGHTLTQRRKVGIGGGQQAPRRTAERQRQCRRSQHAQRLTDFDAAMQAGFQRRKHRAHPQKEIAEGQPEHPGQAIQQNQAAAVPLGQHSAAGQHVPDGENVPRHPLPRAQRLRLVAEQRVRQRQRQPAPAQIGVSRAAVR